MLLTRAHVTHPWTHTPTILVPVSTLLHRLNVTRVTSAEAHVAHELVCVQNLDCVSTAEARVGVELRKIKKNKKN